MKRTLILPILVVLLLCLLTACLPETHPLLSETPGSEPAGFFLGIWHGWIAPVSLIASLFNDSYTVFDSHNTGFWYGFGFYIAILGGFGGFSLVRRNKDKGKS